MAQRQYNLKLADQLHFMINYAQNINYQKLFRIATVMNNHLDYFSADSKSRVKKTLNDFVKKSYVNESTEPDEGKRSYSITNIGRIVNNYRIIKLSDKKRKRESLLNFMRRMVSEV